MRKGHQEKGFKAREYYDVENDEEKEMILEEEHFDISKNNDTERNFALKLYATKYWSKLYPDIKFEKGKHD